MVNNISKIYSSGPLKPTSPADQSKKTQAASAPSTSAVNPAARLIPDLRDKVEISEEGLKASQTKTVDGDEKLPEETINAIGSNWFSVGFGFSSDALKGE